MPKIPAELFIQNLRGGLNDYDNPNAIEDDQCTVVENIDFSRSTLGGRRLGADAIDMTGSTLSGGIVALHRHLPSGDQTAAELWAVSTSDFASTFVVNRKTTVWAAVSPNDAITDWKKIRFFSFHGKLFIAYDSAQDRMHVWDGTSWRRTGVATPAAPSVANTGAGTYPAIIRYYRVRYTEQVGGVTVRKSEPSPSQSFTPSGTGTHARVTKPAAVSEGETHWELEASADNVNFYRIATTVVGTTTYDDNAAPSTYATTGTLSEDSGDYTNISSFEFLAADEDRLLVAGHHETEALKARVSWTPVFGDPGVGNDERIPIDTNNFVDLDGRDGGSITDMAPGPLNGYIYVFKRQAIYKLIRTNTRTRAYDAICVTKSLGALKGSVHMGQDENGAPCIYFLEPRLGPYRITTRGIQACGYDVRGTWRRVVTSVAEGGGNLCGVFYPDKQQMQWWVPLDAATKTSHTIVANIREFRFTDTGARRGWAHYTGNYATNVHCACLFADNIDAGAARSLVLVPFLGRTSGAEIYRTETTNQDNGTNFQARLTSKPFIFGNLLQKFAIRAATLMAKVSTGVTVQVTMNRNHGLESQNFSFVLTADGAESRVIKENSEVKISSVKALQVTLGDAAAQNADWELDALGLSVTDNEKQ